MNEIYLDNNASTPLAPEVLEAMLPYHKDFYGNPSSLHKKGIEAERALKEARSLLADIFSVADSEVYFTSGATESDNLALKGVARAKKSRGTHIITAKTEHEAVLESCKQLEEEGFHVEYLDVDEYGNVDVKTLVSAVREDTILVAIMHANNELGTVYPVNELAKAVKNKNPKTIFFSDGVQAFGKLEMDLAHIDLYAISAHKMHGPKGVGVLVVKENISPEILISGGGQERGLRSGTENVPGIVGLGKAAEMAYSKLQESHKHIWTLRNEFIRTLKSIPDVRINSPENGVAGTINAGFKGVPAEVLLHALEEKGVYVSTGSACGTHKQEISHVLEAAKVPYEYINSSLRFSFSRYNSLEELKFAAKTLVELVKELRSVGGVNR